MTTFIDCQGTQLYLYEELFEGLINDGFKHLKCNRNMTQTIISDVCTRLSHQWAADFLWQIRGKISDQIWIDSY